MLAGFFPCYSERQLADRSPAMPVGAAFEIHFEVVMPYDSHPLHQSQHI